MNQPANRAARRPDGAALAIAAGLAVIGGVMVWDAARLPAAVGYAGIGPADIPRLIGLALIGLALWTLIAGYRGETVKPEHQELPPVLWIVAGLGAQLVLLNIAGFSIATGLLFAFAARAFGKRELWQTIPLGIVFAFVVYAVFNGLLKLHLPSGPLELLLMGH